MKKIIFSLILSVLILPSISFAHPGRTDSSGGHTCRTNCVNWGLSYGQYHYHNTPKIITPTQNASNNISSTYHGINYQGDCYSYELSVSEYDKKAKEYFSSKEYANEKEIWRKKLETKDSNFLRKDGVDYESFLSTYEFINRYKTTNLDDTYCFRPLVKLSEYANSKIQAYSIEENNFRSKTKRFFNWLF